MGKFLHQGTRHAGPSPQSGVQHGGVVPCGRSPEDLSLPLHRVAGHPKLG